MGLVTTSWTAVAPNTVVVRAAASIAAKKVRSFILVEGLRGIRTLTCGSFGNRREFFRGSPTRGRRAALKDSFTAEAQRTRLARRAPTTTGTSTATSEGRREENLGARFFEKVRVCVWLGARSRLKAELQTSP